MTAEKRWQMQKLKEEAICIEQRLRKRRQKEHSNTHEWNKNFETSTYLPKTVGNICHQLQPNDEYRLKKSAESIDILNKILDKQQETAKNAKSSSFLNNNKEKLTKLQKSETLIYDNFTDNVIKVSKEGAVISADNLPKQLITSNTPNKLPNNLLLAGEKAKRLTVIPSICLNPPTPLAAQKSWCVNLNGTESGDLAITSENQLQSMDCSQEHSSDESCKSMITQSNKELSQINIKHNNRDRSSQNTKKTSLTREQNVCEKIQQFEAISTETNSPQTSPERVYKNSKLCPSTLLSTINRSVTSPSIKINTTNHSSSCRSQSLIKGSDNSPETNLVRSSSFTLEGPSKALIEHMQQQKVINSDKTGIKTPSNATRKLAGKSRSAAIRAHRDTIESKAKKVKKMEFKSPNTPPKITSSKLAQSAVASTSPYNTETPTQYLHFVCKTKRSSSPTSPQMRKPKTCTQTRKSNTSSPCLDRNKSSKLRLTSSASTTASCSSSKATPSVNSSFNHSEMNKKLHLLHLLAQQEEEHRNLHKSFELQQKFLIEQLTCNNSRNSTPNTKMTKDKHFEEQQTLAPRNCNYDHVLPKSAVTSYDLERHETKAAQHQSPHLISDNSSYMVIESSHPNSSHDSNFTQPTQANPVHNQHFFSINRSNANTFWDICSLSEHSPVTSLIQNNTAKNMNFNKSTPSFCRRLFTAEINGAKGSDCLSAHSVVSTSFANSTSSAESTNQQQQQLICDDNCRVSEHNDSILHEAATKINAFARGFLVRRLFKTEQIQRIVQTIRDTLIFVLNLHIETVKNPEESMTPANIKLKARLLQQLSSACCALHLAFFQTSIKERMEIIARDRKRIKTKLMMTRKT